VRNFAASLAPTLVYFAAQSLAESDLGYTAVDVPAHLGAFLARRHAVSPELALCVVSEANEAWAEGLCALPLHHFLNAGPIVAVCPHVPPVFVPPPSDRMGELLPQPDASQAERFCQHGRVHGVCNPSVSAVLNGAPGGNTDELPTLTEEQVKVMAGSEYLEKLTDARKQWRPDCASACAQDGLSLSAHYRGTDSTPYEVELMLSRDPASSELRVLSSSCSCPAMRGWEGGRPFADEPVCCKHVFSLLLTREKQPTRFGAAAIPLAASPAVPLSAAQPTALGWQAGADSRALPAGASTLARVTPTGVTQPPIANANAGIPPAPKQPRTLPTQLQLGAVAKSTAARTVKASSTVPTAAAKKPRAKAVAKEVVDLCLSEDDDLDPIPPRPKVVKAEEGREATAPAPRPKAESAKRPKPERKAAGRSILIDPLPAMLTGAFLREYAVESLRLLEDEEKAAKRARTSVSPLRVVDSAAGAAQQIHSTLAGAGSACPPPPGLPPGPGADAGASNIPPLQARHGSDAGAQQAQDAGAVGRTPAAPAPWAAPASSGGAQALPAVQSAPASATGALPDAASPVKPPAPKPAAKEESVNPLLRLLGLG